MSHRIFTNFMLNMRRMSLYRKIFLLFLCLFTGGITFSQEAAAVDSIKNELAKATTAQDKVSWLDELSRTMMNVNPKEADEYGKKLIAVAEESRDRKLMFKAYLSNGIRCNYHGRRFNVDGKFLSMPEFEKAENFPTEKDNLSKIPLANWEQFLFASINPIAPLTKFIAEMSEKLSGLNFAKLKFVSAKDYQVNAHWALYCENYLEGFHVPFVHQSLNAAIDYGTYTTETFRFSSLQTGFDENGELAAQYFFIFPNLMFNFYPWGISVNLVKPVTPTKTIVIYLTYISDESKLNIGAGADLETVELEDQAVVESVQRGIRSIFYDSGRYSPTRELGTHHFHRLICEFMG